MPLLWLRVALGCYAIGLLYALLALTQRSYLLNRIALPAMSLGMVFQFVSLSESVLVGGPVTITLVHNSESFLALLVMVAFMIVYLVCRLLLEKKKDKPKYTILTETYPSLVHTLHYKKIRCTHI